MKQRESNQGYEITERFVAGELGYVLGESGTAPAPFVTWCFRTDSPKHYFWGRYFNTKDKAMENYRERISDELDYVAERTGKPPLLPLFCYAQKPSSGEIVRVERGFRGYEPATYLSTDDNAERTRAVVDYHNGSIGVTRAQEEAMLAGSMFGWDTKAADPRSYDENGQPKRTQKRDEPER